jgi:hypothetical protein
VHVEHSVHIKRSVQDVSSSLIDSPSKWFPRSVGLHVAGVPVRKKVTVEFGDPVKTTTWAVVPVTWKATFPEKLFPIMHGKVDVSPVTNDETKLTVSGMYEPPLGRLGEELNEAVMHRVAQGTVRELAESIAKRLEKPAKS